MYDDFCGLIRELGVVMFLRLRQIFLRLFIGYTHKISIGLSQEVLLCESGQLSEFRVSFPTGRVYSPTT